MFPTRPGSPIVGAAFFAGISAADYLRLAAGAGLGIYEQGGPWGSGYSQINAPRSHSEADGVCAQ